jgi:hypothetical protein
VVEQSSQTVAPRCRVKVAGEFGGVGGEQVVHGGRDRDVRTRVQAQQPEQLGGGGRERVARPGEDPPDVGRGVEASERVQVGSRIGQLFGERSQLELRSPDAGPGGHDGEREGQPATAIDDASHGLWLGGRPLSTQAVAEQAFSVVVR